MNEFGFNELKNICAEINADEDNHEMADKVADTVFRLIEYLNISRREGLLMLEDEAENLDLRDESQAFFRKMIMLIVDGTDPKTVEAIGVNSYISGNCHSYLGLICFICIQGSLMIQAGEAPNVFREVLISMLPKSILEVYMKRVQQYEKEQKEKAEWEIQELCRECLELDEQDHSVINETARALLALSDRDMQRLLRDTENGNLAFILKELPGQAREKVFNNLSLRLGSMIVDYMKTLGPVNLKSVEESCITIMRQLIKLESSDEIAEYDFSILKIVIDMYEAAEQENRQLRRKYKEVWSLMNEIYQD